MSASETATGTSPGVAARMSLPTLTAMVVGSMVGAGVFSLPARFGVATGILGSLIAWAIAGAGMLMLAFVFQNLAIRRPDLDSGVFIYAKAGFGDYAGFNSAIGFWASAVAGNTFYWVFITATLGVSTLLYLPYAVFCYASPALSVLYGVTGFRIEKVGPPDPHQMEESA